MANTTIIKGQQSNGLHKDIWTTFETKTTESISIERADTTKKTLFYNVFLNIPYNLQSDVKPFTSLF
jgi:hypothetical protein